MITAPLLSPLLTKAQQPRLENWAGNIQYSTGNVFYPKTVDEVRELVKKLKKFRALGTRHCFNRIADSKHNLVSTNALNQIVGLDAAEGAVTVEGGIRYGELAPWLHEKGFALQNLASLPHISVAGSITTATHGSGVNNRNLAGSVRALELVTSDGKIRELRRDKDGEQFRAAVVGLGALGIITKVTLDVEPAYQVQQRVYLDMPLTELKDNFDDILSAGYSVSLFTDWQRPSINEVWVKQRSDGATAFTERGAFFGAEAATKNMHPIAELPAENCTEQMGVDGPWYERLPHFKMGFTPSSGKELQAEYFVPYEHAVDAILAIQGMGKLIGPHLFISEIRTVAADDLWMSPCYKQKSVAIHFTWKQEVEAVMRLLPLIEKELMPFNVRPHWGKLFTLPAAWLAARYERLKEFKALVSRYDPQKKLQNDFLSSVV